MRHHERIDEIGIFRNHDPLFAFRDVFDLRICGAIAAWQIECMYRVVACFAQPIDKPTGR